MGEKLTASMRCPICGKAEPHAHAAQPAAQFRRLERELDKEKGLNATIMKELIGHRDLIATAARADDAQMRRIVEHLHCHGPYDVPPSLIAKEQDQ